MHTTNSKAASPNSKFWLYPCSQTNLMNKETKRKHRTQKGKDLQQPIHNNHTSLQRQNNKTTCISPTSNLAIFPMMRSIVGLQRVQLSWGQTIKTLLCTSAALHTLQKKLYYCGGRKPLLKVHLTFSGRCYCDDSSCHYCDAAIDLLQRDQKALQ